MNPSLAKRVVRSNTAMAQAQNPLWWWVLGLMSAYLAGAVVLFFIVMRNSPPSEMLIVVALYAAVVAVPWLCWRTLVSKSHRTVLSLARDDVHSAANAALTDKGRAAKMERIAAQAADCVLGGSVCGCNTESPRLRTAHAAAKEALVAFIAA